MLLLCHPDVYIIIVMKRHTLIFCEIHSLSYKYFKGQTELTKTRFKGSKLFNILSGMGNAS